MHAKSGRLFAHSHYDLWLVLVTAAGIALLWLSWRVFGKAGAGWLFSLWLIQVLLVCTNYQCVAHNFVHNEFFTSAAANTLFSMLNSLAIGFPQTIFREHHLNHHRYNNQAFTEAGGVGDRSSLYRFSPARGRPEGFLRYVLLSPLRADIPVYARAAVRRGYAARLAAEASLLALAMAVMAAGSWRYFLAYYLTLLYFGHVVTYAEGYFEHYDARPGDRMRNAVSCYGRCYNFLWFNNGYHQEHHCYPGVHWVEIPRRRASMLAESERKVVKVAHWMNF